MKKSNVRVIRFFSLMILLLTIPLAEFYIINKEVVDFEKISGVVVGVSPEKCGTMKTECWRLVIEYKIGKNETNRIFSNSASSFKSIGKSRAVLVNPNNAYDARDAGFGGIWFPLQLHTGLVFCFALLLIPMYLQDFKVLIKSFKKLLARKNSLTNR